jgi:tRNA A-37 threonylcarbamoyl transferase component Bud32
MTDARKPSAEVSQQISPNASTSPAPVFDPVPASDATANGEMPAAKVDPYVGKTIDGRYLVERLLGEGGMGVVYAARHRVIDKKVAIKVLRGEMATDHDLNERFLQEARAASAIGNPHIIDISDFGRLPDGSTYFVMEFLDGKSLSELLLASNGPVGVSRLCHLAKQLARGLEAAHAASIVHRDLKPDNVMIINRGTEKDFIKILDFGIAKVGTGTKKMTRAGSVFGTPHYMSPEQAAGAIVDHRTDIYALGVILYEMASGKVPFDADNFMGILTQHMYKAPVPIRALVPEIDVPAGLDAIVLKCLTKKPEGRYQTMGALAADLEKLENGILPDAVHEMMARSGGFNIPSDYFRTSAMPALLPASPVEHKPRWPLYAVIAAVATIVGTIGVGVIARATSSAARVPPVLPAGPSASIAQVAAETATVAVVASVPSAAAAPATREILVSVVPPDSKLMRDNKDLGGGPVALHLTEGEKATLVVSKKGFKTKTVIIDGREPKEFVSLEPTFVASQRAPMAAPPKPPPSNPLGGIDDVGDPFSKKR